MEKSKVYFGKVETEKSASRCCRNPQTTCWDSSLLSGGQRIRNDQPLSNIWDEKFIEAEPYLQGSGWLSTADMVVSTGDPTPKGYNVELMMSCGGREQKERLGGVKVSGTTRITGGVKVKNPNSIFLSVKRRTGKRLDSLTFIRDIGDCFHSLTTLTLYSPK